MGRLSMNETTTYQWSFEADVLNYQAAGYEAIGVWRAKLSDYGEDKGRELLAESGLKVSNLLWAGGFTGSDGRTYADAIDDGKEAIQLAACLGAPCLVMYSGSPQQHTQRHARRLFATALDELLPVALDCGVDLAVEIVHPASASSWTWVTNISEAVELLDELNHPNLRLAIDTYHLAEDSLPIDEIAAIADDIAIVHLGDRRAEPDTEQQRCPLGRGVVPVTEVLAALVSAGYDGFFDVKLFGEEIAAIDYRELIEHSRRSFEEMMVEAVAK